MYSKLLSMQKYLDYLEQNKEAFLNELKEFLKIPSISADHNYKPQIMQAANFLQDQLKKLGFTTIELLETEDHPLVFGEYVVDSAKPTVLLYSHYDVQPPDPLAEWQTPPFEPEIRNQAIYARGAADNKAPLFCHLKAVETLLKTKGLPLNVKFIFDGGEEIGSEGLVSLLKQNPEKFKADLALISDTSMILDDLPSLAISLRGLVYLEVIINGPNRDLHSGQNGGLVQNPINALATMVAKITDDSGKITIPGFYDQVLDLTEAELKELATIPFDLTEYKNKLGVSELTSDSKIEILKRLWVKPTFDCNGIKGGYLGEGQKTIIPSQASAKLSFRIVPNQNPQQIKSLVEAYLHQIKPAGVTLKIIEHSGCFPVKIDHTSKQVQLALKVLTEVYGHNPFLQGVGESIPLVLEFNQTLGMPCLLLGFGKWSDNIHSPNENFKLDNFYKGILTLCRFLEIYK